MIKKRKFPRIFPGWWIVLSGGFLDFWVYGYQGYGISALFKPIASELGFTRAAASIPASISRLEGAFESPLAGWFTDRYGPRWIIFFGIFLVGLSLILMNFINSLWGYYLVWGVMLGTGHNVSTTIPVATAITSWFVKKRGRALSVKWVLSGLSGVIVLPLIAWLITSVGWRQTCLIGGIVMWVGGLPLAWFFLKRHRPEYYGLLPDGATTEEAVVSSQMIDKGVEYAAEVDEVEFTLRQAMKTSAFWLLITAQAVHGLAWVAFQLHTIPFLTDIGIDPLAAAAMAVIYVSVGLPFRFIGGILADRLKRQHLRFLMAGSYFLQAIGIIIFLLNQTTAMIYVWFVLLGIGWGSGITSYSVIGGRYFGRKAFGSIRGTGMAIMAPVSIVSAIGAGWIYDTTGSYISAFVIFAAALTATTIIVSMARPPKPPPQITGIRSIT